MDRIKADGPAFPCANPTTIDHDGMPIKLVLAKDFMAAHIQGSVHAGFPYKRDEVATEALKDAEALINAYNQSK